MEGDAAVEGDGGGPVGDSVKIQLSKNITDLCFISVQNVTSDMIEEQESNYLLKFIFYGVLLTVVGFFGLVGNMISIAILSRPNMRSSINCCLIGLTTFDIILITTSILMFSIPAIHDYTGYLTWYSEEVFPIITPIVFPLGLTAQTGSVYLTFTVTVERYVAVCHPLRARSLCTYGRAKVYVIIVALFSVLYNLPRFWEVMTVTCGNGKQEVLPTKLRLDSNYIEVYIMWLYLIVMYLIPFFSLLVFNTFIYKQVRLANHERQRLSRLQKKEIGLAVMLLVVVTVFFICNVMAFVLNVLEIMKIDIDWPTIVSNFLVTVNSSVNFVIYCTFGQKFRKLFFKMFCYSIFTRDAMHDATFMDSQIGPQNSVYAENRALTNGNNGVSIRLASWGTSHHHHHHHHGRLSSGNINGSQRTTMSTLSSGSMIRAGSAKYSPPMPGHVLLNSRSPSVVSTGNQKVPPEELELV